MNSNNEYSVPFSRKKILSVIRTNLFFVLIFSFFLVMFTIKPTERTPIFQLLATPLILLFAFVMISALRKLKNESPGLIVNSQGIIENSSFFPVGLIHWNDVISLYVQQARSSRWLMIQVRDPERYFNQDNYLIHAFQWLNSIFGGSSFFLSAGLIEIDFDEMVELMREYHKKYGST